MFYMSGAFLIPYLIMLFLCGIPLLFMEFTVGQYTRLGPVHALAKICPLFKGEWSMDPFLLALFYNSIQTQSSKRVISNYFWYFVWGVSLILLKTFLYMKAVQVCVMSDDLITVCFMSHLCCVFYLVFFYSACW